MPSSEGSLYGQKRAFSWPLCYSVFKEIWGFTMIRFLVPVAAFLIAVLFSTHVALAGGVLEINHACATSGGCFPGDVAGYPVTITQSGSYRLTGSLDLSALVSVTAIQVQVPAVHLDLGGFELVGPVSCTGSGSTIVCDPPSGGGHGVEIWSASLASSVRNGTVRGFNNGISANPEGLMISDITTINNSNDGVSAAAGVVVNDCVSMNNGGDGFDGDAGSVFQGLMALGNGLNGIEIDDVGGVVSGSTSRGNGGFGFNIVALSKFGHDNVSKLNGMEDNCGGGICSPKTRYYISQDSFTGGQALTACAEGFHMASLWEIFDTSNLAYDVRLGRTLDDSGSGPPTNQLAWVRTGQHSGVAGGPGAANCASWTTNSGALGTILRLPQRNWEITNGQMVAPWEAFDRDCDAELTYVWCVED